jgi:hypothetical protein
MRQGVAVSHAAGVHRRPDDRNGTGEEPSDEESEDLAREWHDGDDDDSPGVSATV